MQILLVAATEKEIGSFSSCLPGTDVLITGVGAPATIYHLLKRIGQMDYDLIIQAGIAGSFTEDLSPGMTVLISQDCFGDLGVEINEKFNTVFEEGFCDENEFPFMNGWLLNDHPLLQIGSFRQAKAITVNKVTDNLQQKKRLIKKFSPQVESMEGAALHYVCLQEKIPFLQLRVISNYVGERDRSKWKIKESIEILKTAIGKLVEMLEG